MLESDISHSEQFWGQAGSLYVYTVKFRGKEDKLPLRQTKKKKHSDDDIFYFLTANISGAALIY